MALFPIASAWALRRPHPEVNTHGFALCQTLGQEGADAQIEVRPGVPGRPQRPRIASARKGTRARPRCLLGSGSSPSSMPRIETHRSLERATCHEARGQRSSAFYSFHEARWSGASSRSTASS